MPEGESDSRSIERLADESPAGFATELLEFVLTNKKWWMIPFLLLVGLVGLLAVLAGTGAAPFMYPFF